MSIYQEIALAKLRSQLDLIAGPVVYWPSLSSTDRSLDHQPALSALGQKLGQMKIVVLEGPPGSGKTVLALQMATRNGSLSYAYLPAQKWIPDTRGSLLDDFLLQAGCDHGAAMTAMRSKKLVLILDAIDESPWRSGGATALTSLPALCAELNQKQVGLLVTTRTSAPIPDLSCSVSNARLCGIADGDLDAFVGNYATSRSGVGAAVATLRASPLPENVKYSPLVLRRVAEGLSLNRLPENLVELFELLSDFHIERECQKPATTGMALTPGSWQAEYADPVKHRALVSALVYSSGMTGRQMSESELQRIVIDVLRPANLGARALVDMSTLMAQHPLVSVIWSSGPSGEDRYWIEAAHDWVRTALFPRFLAGDGSTEAQLWTLDTWHLALPHADDFVIAWAYLGNRSDEILEQMVALISNDEQAREVAFWLLSQAFHPCLADSVAPKLICFACRVAHRFLSAAADVLTWVDFANRSNLATNLHDQVLKFSHVQMNCNFSGVVLEQCQVVVEEGGPELMRLTSSFLENVVIVVRGDALIELDGCMLSTVHVNCERGRVVLSNCSYDPATCTFPAGVEGLETCTREDVREAFLNRVALAGILRKLVFVADPERPNLAKRRTNVAEDNVVKAVPQNVMARTNGILNAMTNAEYLQLKPTGGVRRYDPTSRFDAAEAAFFFLRPGQPVGPMIADILARL